MFLHGTRITTALKNGGGQFLKLSVTLQDSVYAASGGQNVEPSCLPRDIQTIVDFLVDDRDLSTMEYDKLIR